MYYATILCAHDGTAACERALAHAAQLADERRAQLHIVHVVERIVGGRMTGETVALDAPQIEQRIRAQAARLRGGDEEAVIVHTVRGTPGHVADRIAHAADELDAEVIVTGCRGRSALAGLVLGSVTQRLGHLTGRPVLHVPGTTAAPAPETAAPAPETATPAPAPSERVAVGV